MSANTRTRPRSRRTKAKKVRYTYESDTGSANGSSQISRPSRRSQRIQSYVEDSDESPSDLESLDSGLDRSPQPAPRNKKYHAPPTRSKTQKRKRNHATTKNSMQNFQLFKRRKPNSLESSLTPFTIGSPPSGKIPPWQELPYLVLQQIVKCASFPLYEKASRTTASIEWLCGISLLCKSFHEAAVAALLYSPPLYPAWRAQGLLRLLSKDQTKTATNYRNKIKCLDIEVKNLLIRKSGVDILELLDRTPLLERLRLYHNHDDLGTVVWAQPSQSKGKRWAYPKELFQKLDDMGIKLKSWEWNGRFPSGKDVLQTVARVHTRPSFSELRELSFINITLPEKGSEENTTLANTLLVSALHHSTKLDSLTFRNCTILNHTTFSQLPPALSSLEIVNCQYLTAEHLSIYLSSAGTSLRSLSLAGNQSMSLAFLTNLARLCPRLQRLNLDLTYTDPSSYRDRDPLYDEALPDGPPSWPAALASVEIENLRQLKSSEAEDFFTSLVNAAPQLTQLRKIVIKAIVKDASWRDRAELRKKWIPQLEDTFLDMSEPMTLTSIPKPKPQPKPVEMPELKTEEQTALKKPAGRQSNRIAHLKQLSIDHSQSTTGASDSNDSFSDTNASSSRCTGRHNVGLPLRTNGRSGDGFVQGQCQTVTLVLSDQRPAQDQYHEADFLDSERSGDEEWRGRDLDFD